MTEHGEPRTSVAGSNPVRQQGFWLVVETGDMSGMNEDAEPSEEDTTPTPPHQAGTLLMGVLLPGIPFAGDCSRSGKK